MIINKILKAEYKLKLDKVATFKDFFKNINNLKKRLNKILVSIKNNNQNIHCYGASTKGNVLLQYYKINNRMINFVAERNKNKYGLFTPGTKIKLFQKKAQEA